MQRCRYSKPQNNQTLSEEDRNRYSALTAALELWFGDEHLKQVFATQVKTRTQKAGESLQEFAAVRLAYSDAPPSFQDRLATETFATVKLRRYYKY